MTLRHEDGIDASDGARSLRPRVPECIIRVLLVEDSNLEARMLADRIGEARYTDFRIRRVDRLSRAMEALAAKREY